MDVISELPLDEIKKLLLLNIFVGINKLHDCNVIKKDLMFI